MPQNEPRRRFEQQRLAELQHPAASVGTRTTCDIDEADEQRRHRDHEPGDRAGDADVEQHPLARNRLADADEGAHRAGQQERHRDEKRQRRVDVIIAAREIVAELVAAEDAREWSPLYQKPRSEQRRTIGIGSGAAGEIVEEAGIVIGADERRGDDRSERTADTCSQTRSWNFRRGLPDE